MEMDCAQAREEFASLLDGELAPEERAAVEGHLSQCSDCLRDLDGLKRVDTLYRGMSKVSAPAGFEEGVRQGIRSATVLRFPGLGRPRKRIWPALLVAAGFLVVLGAIAVQFAFPTDRNIQVAILDQNIAAAPASPPTVAATQEKLGAPVRQEVGEAKGVAEKTVSSDLLIKQEESQAAPAPAAGGGAVAAAKPAPRDRFAAEAPSVAANTTRLGAAKTKETAAPAPAPPAAAPPAAETPKAVPELGVAQAPPASDRKAEPPVESKPQVMAEAAPAPAPPDAPKIMLNSAAPAEAAASADTTNAPAAQAYSAAPPAPAAKLAAPSREKLAGTTFKAEEKSLPSVKTVGKRTFELKSGIWREAGYSGQDTTRLVRGSQDLQRLIGAHPELGEALELGERVVFKVGDRWYRVEPHAAK
jgi:hypothetical protein